MGSLLKKTEEICSLKQRISLSESKNLTFWYYMNGAQIGTLSLVLDENILWSVSDSQDEEWLHAGVILPKGNHLVRFWNLVFKI